MALRAMVCSRNARYTTRDSLIGAAVMIGLTLVIALGGAAAKRDGWLVAGEVLLNLSFLAPFTLSMPFWLMKDQPWKAQLVIVGGTLALLVAITFLSTI